MNGWLNVKKACAYANVSERIFRTWLKEDLRHVRPKHGPILIKAEWIDQYLSGFEVVKVDNEVDKIVEETCREFSC